MPPFHAAAIGFMTFYGQFRHESSRECQHADVGPVPSANRYASHWAMNPALMTTSIISGCRLIWLVNKANFLTTIQQVRPVICICRMRY